MKRLSFSQCVCLILLFCCSNILRSQVSADFKADTLKGCDVLAKTSFTDLSTGNIISWDWSFGNGGFSSVQHPTTSFTQTGLFDVRLIVSDGVFSDTLVKKAYIKVYQGPTAEFSLDTTVGCTPFPVHFEDLSQAGDNPINEWLWNYGDGSSSANSNDHMHVYEGGGRFFTSLIVVDSAGCKDSYNGGKVATELSPTASFKANGTLSTCQVPLTVSFLNLTTNTDANTRYLWDFGDGTFSTLANPSNTYLTPGSYDVKLLVTNGNCADSLVFQDLVNIEKSIASFSLVKPALCYKIKQLKDTNDFCKVLSIPDTLIDTLKVKNLSRGGENFFWDFGDGTTSTDKEPIHVYTDTGRYDIKLSMSSGVNCKDDTTISVYVESVYAKAPIIKNFPYYPAQTCVLPDTFYFRDTSSNVVAWDWIFQTDSSPTIKTGQNVYKSLNVERSFTDSLIVTGLHGCRDTLRLDDRWSTCVKELKKPTRAFARPGLTIEADGLTEGCSPLVLNFEEYPSSGLIVKPAVIVPGTRKWDFDNGNTDTSRFVPTQTFVKDTTYRVRLTAIDTSGCEVFANRLVTVGKPSNPVISVRKDSLCFDDDLDLIEVSGNDKIRSWEWSLVEGIGDTSGVTYLGFSRRVRYSVEDEIIPIVNRDPAVGAYGIKIVTAYNGCADSAYLLPAFGIRGPLLEPHPTFELEECGKLKVLFYTNAIDADTYLWDFGDSTSSTDKNPVHTFPTERAFIQKYSISNSKTGCKVDGSFSLGVSNLRGGITAADTLNCIPFLVDLSADSNTFTAYNWFLEGEQLETVSSVYKERIDSAGVYNFGLRLSNGFGCVDTSKITIVAGGAEMKIGKEEIAHCIPQEVIFRDSSVYAFPSKSVQWDFGNGFLSNRTVESTRFEAKDSSYTILLIVEDSLGCRDSLLDTLHTPNIYADFLIIDSTLCSGDIAEFNNVSSHLDRSFVWSFGDGEKSTATNPTPHAYQNEKEFKVNLKMRDSLGCEVSTDKLVSVQDKPIAGFYADLLETKCPDQRINFYDTSLSNHSDEWEWTFGNIGGVVFQNPSMNLNEKGEYDVTLMVSTSHGCADTLTKKSYIKVGGPSANFSISKDTVCKYEDVVFSMLDADGVGDFEWIFGDGNTANGVPSLSYQYETKTGMIHPVLILFSEDSSCVLLAEPGDSIFVQEVIADFEVLEDTIGCEPYQVILNNTSLSADSTWGWDFGDGNQSINFNDSNTYVADGTYQIRLTISSKNGCVDTSYQKITVLPIPEIVTSADTTICEGDAITLSASGGDIYNWSPTMGLQSPSAAQTIADPIESQLYKIEVSTNEGCIDSSFIALDVQPKPEVYSLLDDTSLIIGEELQLDVNTGSTYSFDWNPKRWMSCYDCPEPLAQPLETTVYVVNITDAFGCFPITDSIRVDVTVDFSLDVPQAFSPNGDGNNDKIFVRGWGIKKLLDFKIYNRWGEVVYESQELNEGWNGEYRGKPQNIEMYVYTVSVLTFHDKILTKKGNFSLMR